MNLGFIFKLRSQSSILSYSTGNWFVPIQYYASVYLIAKMMETWMSYAIYFLCFWLFPAALFADIIFALVDWEALLTCILDFSQPLSFHCITWMIDNLMLLYTPVYSCHIPICHQSINFLYLWYHNLPIYLFLSTSYFTCL